MRLPRAVALPAVAALALSSAGSQASSQDPAAAATASPPISVSLRAPWSAPHLLFEALEAANSEDPEAFWPLLTHITGKWVLKEAGVDAEALSKHLDGKGPSPLASASDELVYKTAQRVMAHQNLLAAKGARDNWKLALALHSEAPKVEAHWNAYLTSGMDSKWEAHVGEGQREQCGSWVEWGEHVICDDLTLQQKLAEANGSLPEPTTIRPFDHVFSSTSSGRSSAGPAQAQSTAVLYADPFSPNFWSLHTTLFEHALGSRPPLPGFDGGSSKPAFAYVLRWRPPRSSEGGKAPQALLSGYGATLDLKKVDYLVIDDRKIGSIEAGDELPDAGEASEAARADLDDRAWLDGILNAKPSDQAQALSSLTEEEIKTLGVRAAHAIASSPDPFRALRQLSQDFPLHAIALARRSAKPSKAFLAELAKSHEETIEAGHNSAWVNGKPILEADFTPFGLLSLLRDEHKLVNSLTADHLNLSSKQAIDLLSQDSLASAQDKDSQQSVFFDASDRLERAAGGEKGAGAVDWWNDLETDDKHPKWSNSLQELLRPLWPGQFPMIRRNLFNTVFVLDLGRKDLCRFAADSIFAASQRIGLHIGFVPAGLEREGEGEGELSTQIARLYWRVLEELGPSGSAKFLKKVSASAPPTSKHVDLKAAVREFRKIMEADSEDAVTDWAKEAKEVLAGSKFEARERSVRAYVERLRLTLDEAELGHVLVNGQHLPFSPQVFQLLHQLITGQMQTLASMFYYQKLADEDDVSTYFYDLPTTFKARSALVFPPADEDTDRPLRQQAVNLVEVMKAVPASLATSSYVLPEDTSPINSTIWLFADFDSEEGAKLLISTLEALGTESFRLGLVHSPSAATSPDARPSLLLSTLLFQALSSDQADARRPEALLQVAKEALAFYESQPRPQLGRVEPDVAEADQIKLGSGEAAASYAQERGWQLGASIEADRAWREAAAFSQACGVQSGSTSLLINGKLLSDLDSSTITPGDISTLLAFEGNRVIRGVAEELGSVGVDLHSISRERRADIVALASSVINVAYHRDGAKEGIFSPASSGRTRAFDEVETKHISFELGDLETATLRLFAVVNPLAETAQRWSSTLDLLASLPGVHIRVMLNPVPQLSEVPIKRFYRYSAPSTLRFDAKGREKQEPLVFAGMPEEAVLTLGLDTPSTWLTMPEEAVYDLDNIRLRDVPANARSAGVTAIYELKSILIQGHARDEASLRAIPKGLQLILETPDGSEQLDTIVMANLAYFQFRAKPGLYRLRLRPGRSDELYDMVSVGNLGWESPTVNVTGLDITLDSLQGLTIYPRVRKRAGKERESLVVSLDEKAAASSAKGDAGAAAEAASTAKGLFGRLADKANDALGKAAGASATAPPSSSPAARTQADINIFTVASGHLYERMTYIMILSVLRHTKSSVKFWFIENFLSPSFKTFIPHLAKEYGFEYELVTYAWPHWLRAQREKQRTIWGYKILFLDVLFPLDLSKVIFVDADQIVRADLKELIDEDLHGAPYAYPPMGNDSYDMDNYRFWEQGYWKSFLRGKPYHISALYVVDLVRFRRVAAGDMLRGQYQGLSADPGSLANLDQDLPNNMQFQLPIHTLDKNWLWCETWCAAERLPLAKTIDLCQNPRSREAKLDRARRQIPEWTAYDDEVAAFARRLAEKDQLGTNVVAKAEVKQEPSGGGKVHDEL